jgi:glycosyltransferase involved in cell wall biosynthesis
MKQDDRKISICIPTWERTDLLLDSFASVYSDNRVSEIVIVDDYSSEETYWKVKELFEMMPKIKLFRNPQNINCYRNKRRAVGKATNEWVIVFDSDNQLSTAYLDKIFEQEWHADTILTPDFAMPQFDFRKYSGIALSKENISEYIDKPMLEVCLNAMNYFVNRDKYMEVWDETTDPVTSDSIYQAYNWLKAGYKIKIVDGLQYFHSVHPESHYATQNHRTPSNFHSDLLQKIRELK